MGAAGPESHRLRRRTKAARAADLLCLVLPLPPLLLLLFLLWAAPRRLADCLSALRSHYPQHSPSGQRPLGSPTMEEAGGEPVQRHAAPPKRPRSACQQQRRQPQHHRGRRRRRRQWRLHRGQPTCPTKALGPPRAGRAMAAEEAPLVVATATSRRLGAVVALAAAARPPPCTAPTEYCQPCQRATSNCQ